VLAAVSAAITVAVATPWLQARNVDVNLLSADVITPIVGALLSLTLGVIIGIGIGGVIHNQTIAITVMVVWTSIIEAFLTGFVPRSAAGSRPAPPARSAERGPTKGAYSRSRPLPSFSPATARPQPRPALTS
jgi:hypothetical protein